MNVKVLKKLGYMVHPSDIERVVKAEPGAVERVLAQMMTFLQEKARAMRVREALGEKDRPVSPPQREHAIRVNPTEGSRGPPEKAGPSREREAARMLSEVDTEILVEKEHTIHELRETVMIMSEKIRKLEQLVRIKDTKIESLNSKIDRLERGLS
jgi:hypothetical protein